MHRITCPACGHHIANLNPAATPSIERADPDGRATVLPVRVSEWLAGLGRGRYLASDLRDAFVRTAGIHVTAKEFGLALRSAGAVPRRGSGGERTWEIHGGLPAFGDWLLEQAGRDDPVGDLARDYQLDPSTGGTPAALRRRLAAPGVDEGAREALRAAIDEWGAHRSPHGLSSASLSSA